MLNNGLRGFGAGLIVASGILALVHYQGSDEASTQAKAQEASTLTYEKVEAYLQKEGLVAMAQKKWDQLQADQQSQENKNADQTNTKAKPDAPNKVIKTKLVISKGTSTGQVCNYLETKKIIANSDELLTYLRSNNLESKVRFGNYQVNSNMSIADIATTITSP